MVCCHVMLKHKTNHALQRAAMARKSGHFIHVPTTHRFSVQSLKFANLADF